MTLYTTKQTQYVNASRTEKTPRVAFLFTSARNELTSRIRTGQDADTALHGLNHIAGADYFILPPKSMRAVPFIWRLLRYDFVITQDNLLLGYIVSVCSRAFHLKTRWLYIAINSSTLTRRHAAHPARLFLLKKFWTSYARLICISSEQIEDFVRLGVPRERITLIPLGVDADFFQSANASPEEGIIGSIGRDMGRDYPTLFKAASQVEHPFLVITSPQNIAPDVSIPANVSVLYNRSLLEVRDLYARARLIVVASKGGDIPEGSDCSGQTVILDALASGKAVIATYRSWIPDYLVDGEDLVVVAPNDPEAIVQAINSLWNDPERRKQLAASGHEKVIKRYTTKAFAEGLRKLMHSTV